MTRSTITALILLCLGIALGSGGMYLFHVTIVSDETLEVVQTTVELETIGSITSGRHPLTRDTFLRSSNDYQSAKSLEDPTLHQNSFARSLAVYTYVDGLSEDQITSALETTTSEEQELSQRVRYEFQTALVEKLVIFNPTAALEFLIEHQVTRNDRTFLSSIESLFTDLASSDLKSAIILAKTLEADIKSNAISGIFATQVGESLATHQRIAKGLGDARQGDAFYLNSLGTQQFDDPQSTWNEVVILLRSKDFIPSRALINIAQQWYENDGLSMIDEISATSFNKNFERGIMHHIFEQEAEKSPEYAFQSAMKLPVDDRYTGIQEMVVSTWAKSDPQAAYEAVNSVKHSGQRRNLQLHVISRWARSKPRFVLENLEIFPPHIQEDATEAAIKFIARTSPREAAELTLKHVHSPWNSTLVSDVMDEWTEQDLETAINWVYNGPLNESVSYEWVDALTSHLVYSDPRRAFDLAVRQKIPEGGGFGGMYEIGLEVEVISQIARQNIDLAVELLPKVREGKTRLSAYKSIGNRHIGQGDSKQAFDLGLLLPFADQLEYFQSLSRTWARVDPHGLVESIEGFPTAKIRTNVASGLLSSGWSRRNFTDAQLESLKQYVSDSNRKPLEEQP